MPKIVMINTASFGSHGRLMRDLRTAADSAGLETIIAFGRGPDVDGSMLRIGSRADVLMHVALTRLLDRHALGSLQATRRFVRALDDLAPDMLHLHNLHGYYLHAPTLFDYIRTRNLPTLWTHHDCWALTGHCSHFLRAYCTRWQTGCYRCPLKREYPASRLVDASRPNWRWKKAAFATVPSLRIIVPCQWLSDIMGQSILGGVPRKIVPNGVDLSLFKPQSAEGIRSRFGIAPDIPLLLGVASPFDARKGYDDALKAAKILGKSAHVVLVGLSGKQLRTLPSNMTGLSRTDSPDELVALYNAADCLINPTYEDTYPTVNMEAMACGTPVAGYGVGGAKEQLASACGAPVPVGDVRGLAEAALHMARHKPALSHACRTLAEACFDRRRAVDAYLGIYQSMTGANIHEEA